MLSCVPSRCPLQMARKIISSSGHNAQTSCKDGIVTLWNVSVVLERAAGFVLNRQVLNGCSAQTKRCAQCGRMLCMHAFTLCALEVWFFQLVCPTLIRANKRICVIPAAQTCRFGCQSRGPYFSQKFRVKPFMVGSGSHGLDLPLCTVWCPLQRAATT